MKTLTVTEAIQAIKQEFADEGLPVTNILNLRYSLTDQDGTRWHLIRVKEEDFWTSCRVIDGKVETRLDA